MLTIPLQPIPSQIVKVILGGQNCQIKVYQKPPGIFVDVASDGANISTGIIARDAVPIISRGYVGFIGNLLFIDSQGNLDPEYKGLGIRFNLVYLTAEEYDLIR